jgi:hypothetical protein
MQVYLRGNQAEDAEIRAGGKMNLSIYPRTKKGRLKNLKGGILDDFNLLLLFGGIVLSIGAAYVFKITIISFYAGYFRWNGFVQWSIASVFFAILLFAFIAVSRQGSSESTGDEFDAMGKSMGMKKTDATTDSITKNYSYRQIKECYEEFSKLANNEIETATSLFNKMVDLKNKVDDVKKEECRQICDAALNKLKSMGVL